MRCIFLPPTNEVWGKVIFSEVCVILFTGRISIHGVTARGISVQESLSRGSLSWGLCQGSLSRGSLCRRSLSQGSLPRGSLSSRSLSGSLCQGDPPHDFPYYKIHYNSIILSQMYWLFK